MHKIHTMSPKNKTKLPPLMIGKETFGQRLARIRNEKGYTQVEIAEKTDLIQVLIPDYENDRLRPYHEIIIRFAKAFGISTDELLGVQSLKPSRHKVSMKNMKRMRKIEALPPQKQKILLQSLDMLLKGAESKE